MLGVSSKVDYGLVVVCDLSTLKSDEYLSLTDIAKKRNLSANYLAQIVIDLKNAGLVESKEGKNGGHRLTKKLDKIFLSDIIMAFEKDIAFVPCLSEKTNCKSEPFCITKNVWRKVQADFMCYCEKKSLKELFSEKKEKSKKKKV